MSLHRRHVLSLAAGALVGPMVWAAGARAQAGKLSVVATTSMIADAARVVGGDLVEMRGLMGPGIDPHSYRQTRSDIAALTRADLVLWHGLYLEAQMEEFLLKLAGRQPGRRRGRGGAGRPVSATRNTRAALIRMSGWFPICGCRWWTGWQRR